MKNFMLLYKGPTTPPDASHAGWPEWFQKVGNDLVSRGTPMFNGFSLSGEGVKGANTTSLNGYSVIRAGSEEDAVKLIEQHPYLALGAEYSIEVYEVPSQN